MGSTEISLDPFESILINLDQSGYIGIPFDPFGSIGIHLLRPFNTICVGVESLILSRTAFAVS